MALIMRMIFIASLVIAFAFPYKKDNNAVNNNVDNLIAVYIDNSMSMQSHSLEKTLFEDSRSSALKIVESLNQAQKFVLLSNDRDPKNEYPMNKDEMIICLNEMNSEAAPTSFEDIYNSLALIKKKNNFNSATLFVYSDFQKNMMNINYLKSDSTIQVVLFPLKSDFQKNIYVDSVWLQTPVLQKNMTNELNARIVNETPNDVKGLPVNFSMDDNNVAYATCDVAANSNADVNMQFVIDNDGFRKAKVTINDSPITFDNVYNFILEVRPVINVIEIKPDNVNSYLELLFEGDALVNYQSMKPYSIEHNVINNAQMIVVNESVNLNETMQQSLLDFASHGGTLLIFNDENTENSYIYNNIGIKSSSMDENALKIEYIAKRNSFFDDIFLKLPDNAELPEVKKHVRFTTGKDVLNIISLQNGNPLLMMSAQGNGNVFIISTSLKDEYSDLANHTLFVPLMYKMALIGGNVSQLSYTLGNDKYLKIKDIVLNVDDRISVRSENGMYEMFPIVENRRNVNYISFFENLPSSGFYDIYKNENYVSTVAWNDNRNESQMLFCDKDELTKLLKDNNLNILATIDYEDVKSDDIVEVVVRDSVIWKIFVIIALIALLIEILILRFWE